MEDEFKRIDIASCPVFQGEGKKAAILRKMAAHSDFVEAIIRPKQGSQFRFIWDCGAYKGEIHISFSHRAINMMSYLELRKAFGLYNAYEDDKLFDLFIKENNGKE